MNIRQALKMAVKSISSNKARSLLTMLGVIIGLAAVIVLVSYSQGKNLATKALYESQGKNILEVYAYSWNSPRDIGQELYDYCQGLDEVAGITPNGQIWRDMTITYGAKTLARNDRYGMGSIAVVGGGVYVEGGMGGQQEDHYPTIYLGNDQFGLCNNYTIAKGREISYMEIQNMSQVCVLGSDTAEYLFSFADPIDKTININGRPFRVVGVYESKAAKAVLGKSKNDQNDDTYWIKESLKRQDKLIMLPYTMTRYYNNNEAIDQYYVKARSSGDIKKVVTSLNSFLSGIINQNTGSYQVYNPGEYQENQQKQEDMDNQFIAGIAAISLLVGGIGIMNIMLVTVTERTREIGIRKAIGAERKSIIAQFLIEACLICGLGGLIGIAIGYLGTAIVCKVVLGFISWPDMTVTVGSFLFSLAMGVIFGLYPAVKASGLQPVEALRAD